MNKFRLVVRCQVLVVLAFFGVLGIAITHAGPGEQIKRHPFPVSTFFPLTDDHPSIAMNTDGDFVVVWASLSGVSVEPEEGIWGRRFGRDGTPQGDQFRVSPPRVSLHRDEAPVIAMEADGGRDIQVMLCPAYVAKKLC